jgi:hypothetical protein
MLISTRYTTRIWNYLGGLRISLSAKMKPPRKVYFLGGVIELSRKYIFLGG